MNVIEYKAAVRALLESGAATDEQWDEATESILYSSEDHDGVPAIDDAIGNVRSVDW